MTKQPFYRNKYKSINPSWKESSQIYHDLISKCVNKNTYLLDVGCGHSSLLADVYAKTEHTYGLDPDADAISRNTYIKHIEKNMVEDMSFPDNYFDIVTCAWVLEHLSDPKESFKEIHRVLKPNGKLIFITPNVLNYNVWIIRLIPEKFHDFFTRKLYGREERDTFPKKYKANSPREVNKLLKEAGFTKGEIILNGDPSYISFNDITFRISITLERILNTRLFKNCKVHMIGCYKK
jgi:ubiquinone/menaquinone biosynthesis C-methylase UbiE